MSKVKYRENNTVHNYSCSFFCLKWGVKVTHQITALSPAVTCLQSPQPLCEGATKASMSPLIRRPGPSGGRPRGQQVSVAGLWVNCCLEATGSGQLPLHEFCVGLKQNEKSKEDVSLLKVKCWLRLWALFLPPLRMVESPWFPKVMLSGEGDFQICSWLKDRKSWWLKVSAQDLVFLIKLDSEIHSPGPANGAYPLCRKNVIWVPLSPNGRDSEVTTCVLCI